MSFQEYVSEYDLGKKIEANQDKIRKLFTDILNGLWFLQDIAMMSLMGEALEDLTPHLYYLTGKNRWVICGLEKGIHILDNKERFYKDPKKDMKEPECLRTLTDEADDETKELFLNVITECTRK